MVVVAGSFELGAVTSASSHPVAPFSNLGAGAAVEKSSVAMTEIIKLKSLNHHYFQKIVYFTTGSWP